MSRGAVYENEAVVLMWDRHEQGWLGLIRMGSLGKINLKEVKEMGK